MTVNLKDIVSYCDTRVRTLEVADFPPARNGLQVENNGKVKKIGAAVDAGLIPFRHAAEAGIDFLIVHHGLFWTPPLPFTGANRQKLKCLLDHNIALYSSHLPLDCHPQIGNNALLAQKLGLEVDSWELEYQRTPLAAVVKSCPHRQELKQRLERCFSRVISIEEGPEQPRKIVVLTGSGASAVEELPALGADTLITGELKEHHFNMAQELGLNIYLCGHYATETFGVKALAAEVAQQFGLQWEFIDTQCPL